MHFIINQNPPFEELYVTYEIAKWNFILEARIHEVQTKNSTIWLLYKGYTKDRTLSLS